MPSVTTRCLLTLLALAEFKEAVGVAVRGAQPETRSVHRRPRIVEEKAQFTAYMARHARSYEEGTQEYMLRMDLFSRRASVVQEQNSKANRLWTAGLNALSDRTDQELQAMHGYKRRAQSQESSEETAEEISDLDTDLLVDLPSDLNYQNLTNMQMIRDQGGCGSCWAVTATTVLGAHSELKMEGTNRSFSTQQIVDCVPNPNECGGTGGCQGATVELAFQFTMHVGLKDPEDYGAYTASDGQCDVSFDKHSSPSISKLTEFEMKSKTHKAPDNAPGWGFGMYAWRKLPVNKYEPVMKALYKHGPVAVALAASDLMYYESGIFDGCNDWVVNHAVTLMGYGKEDDTKYWMVQNSWGANWGEGGRFRLVRQKDTEENEAECGTDKDPQAGVACKGDEEPVKVCGTCGILFDSVVPFFDKSYAE